MRKHLQLLLLLPIYPLGHSGFCWCEWEYAIYSPNDSFQVREVGNPDNCSTHYFFHFTTSAPRKVCLLCDCHICIVSFQLSESPSALKSVTMTLQSYDQKRLALRYPVKNNTGQANVMGAWHPTPKAHAHHPGLPLDMPVTLSHFQFDSVHVNVLLQIFTKV